MSWLGVVAWATVAREGAECPKMTVDCTFMVRECDSVAFESAIRLTGASVIRVKQHALCIALMPFVSPGLTGSVPWASPPSPYSYVVVPHRRDPATQPVSLRSECSHHQLGTSLQYKSGSCDRHAHRPAGPDPRMQSILNRRINLIEAKTPISGESGVSKNGAVDILVSCRNSA